MKRVRKANKIILAYLEQYEVITADGKDGLEIAERVYSELINDCYLPVELATEWEVEDILLIDYKYEFSEERSLFLISNDIKFSTFIDCKVNN